VSFFCFGSLEEFCLSASDLLAGLRPPGSSCSRGPGSAGDTNAIDLPPLLFLLGHSIAAGFLPAPRPAAPAEVAVECSEVHDQQPCVSWVTLRL